MQIKLYIFVFTFDLEQLGLKQTMETPQLKLYFDTSDGNILSNIRWIDKRGAVTWPYLKMVKSQKLDDRWTLTHR